MTTGLERAGGLLHARGGSDLSRGELVDEVVVLVVGVASRPGAAVLGEFGEAASAEADDGAAERLGSVTVLPPGSSQVMGIGVVPSAARWRPLPLVELPKNQPDFSVTLCGVPTGLDSGEPRCRR